MRKFTLLLAAMLCIVGIGKMRAEVITAASQLSNTKVYTIKTTRGYMTLNTEQTMIVSTHKSDGTVVNDAAATDDASKQFGILNIDGKYFIYSPKLNKFACFQNWNLVFYNDRGVALDITNDGTGNPDGSKLRFFAHKFGSEGYSKFCLNNNNSGSLVLNSYNGAEAGNTVSIEEVAGITLDVDAAMAVWNGTPDYFDPHKVYTISNKRITNWTANEAGTGLTGTSTYTGASDAYQQFAFFKYNGKPYLYNLGTKKFVATDGSLTANKGDAATIGVWRTGDATYPYCFYIEDRGLLFNAQGSGGFAINAWDSGHDDGNKHGLVEVAGVDVYDEILAYFEIPSWDVTYNIYFNGEKIGEEVRNQDKDSQAALSSAWNNDFCTFTYSVSTITEGVTSVDVTVNWNGPFTIYNDFSSIVWKNYYLDRSDGGESTRGNYYLYNSGNAPQYLIKDPTDKQRAGDAFQWGFVGNPYKLKIYNKLAGSTQTLHPTSTIALADGDSYWSVTKKNVVNSVVGFLIGKIGENSFINEAGGAGNTGLGYWGSATDRGSTYFVADVPEIPLTNVYFDLTYNGVVAQTAAVGGLAIGDDLPAMPTVTAPPYTTFTAPDVTGQTVTEENLHITVPVTWSGPFELATNYTAAHWYNMAVRGNYYVTSDNKTDGALAPVPENAIGLVEDAYQWAFVGDPWHIHLFNKAEGDQKAYAWVSNDNASVPTFVDVATANVWTIKASTSSVTGAFMLTTDIGYQVNQFGGTTGSLKIWNSTGTGDAGSAFTVFDVPTNFAKFVASEISPYFDTTAKYFVLTDAAKEEVNYNPDYKTECSYEAYKSMKEKMTDTFLADLSNYVLPETGYYILKNKYYGTYMGISVSDGELWGNYTSASEAKHIVKLTKTGDDTYTLGMMGKFAPQSVAQSTQVIADETAGTYTLVIPAVGYGAFQADPSNNMSVLHRAGGGDIVGWEAPSAASQWEAIDATSIPFTIDESGYATAYMPFPFEVGEVIPEALPTPVGSWAFDDPENPLASTGTATLTPAIHGTDGDPNEGTKWLETKESLEEANISLLEEGGLYVPKGSSLLMNTNNGATGFDKYTVMFDIKKDDMSGYTPLWQNSMADDKDGSLFIKNGQMGLGGSLGYNGNFSAGQWYRVVLVIDTPNKAALYVDGQLLSSCEHTDSYNKHWLLNGPGAVFFADEDGEEHDIKVRGLRFWDVPFTEDQVVRLGTIEGEGSLTSTVPEAFGNWTFEGGTVNGTGTATMTASSGVVANEDGSITVDESNRLEMTTNAADNMNTYTLMMDVKFPDVARYTALIQTDLNNADDAGLFVHNGQIGINAAGLYYHGTLVNDTWYRIVFVVDDLYGSVYVDGVRVSKSSAQLEKWGISTGLFLFEDEDDDNDEGIATVMNIRFWNEALNPAQIAALATVGTEPNLKAFTGKIHDEWITLNEVSGTVPAREGVILKAAPGTYYLNIINDDIADYGDSFDENDLKGTLEPIPAAGKFILAQPEGKEIGFYKATTGNIAATKAYLQIENTSDIKGYIFKYNDDATAIKDINDFNDVRIIKQNDAIYNLAGQRLQKVQKGINIINGKKVLY